MSPSLRRTALPSTLSTRRRWWRVDAITGRPASAPITTRVITAPSCSIPTATTSKPCATRPSDRFHHLQRGNFVVSAPSLLEHKGEEIARNPNINLSFADAGDQQYVSVADTRPDLGDNRKVAL